MGREILHIFKSRPTLEGAGVHLHRIFGYNEVPNFDPFLLLDHFGSDDPADYIKGFPWHPHRGIETVTYMLTGEVEHGDSIGNSGVIRSGDVQWMTAGSGIIHQEMPKEYKGLMQGFQLWVNLPKAEKMMGPRYRGLTEDQIPAFEGDGLKVKIIAGEFNDVKGPVQDLVVDVEYFDVTLDPGLTFTCATKIGYTVFAYVIEGSAEFEGQQIDEHHVVLFGDGDTITVNSEKGVRFLLITGKPLGEPVAWGGPIVMNTQEELNTAFRELDEGTFIKSK
jgi:redox-sensitive bicupin YhaK (pirin superfamily)